MRNVLIPMAGRGERLAGYGDTIKPLISINSQPMFVAAVNSLVWGVDGNLIFCVHSEHVDEFGIDKIVKHHYPDARVVVVDRREGPADTCIQAKQFIDNDEELIIANCDQVMSWSFNRFRDFLRSTDADGVLVCYPFDQPSNSFVEVDENDCAVRVVEKEVISNVASNGIHWWRRGCDFVWSMQDAERSGNGEFYVAPSYNTLIAAGRKIVVYRIDGKYHHAIGTPHDLDAYLKRVDNFEIKYELYESLDP